MHLLGIFVLGFILGVLVVLLIDPTTSATNRKNCRRGLKEIRDACNHEYHETDIERHSYITGGDRLFRCSKCLKEGYIHIPDIDDKFIRQETDKRFGINRQVTYVRRKDSDRVLKSNQI